MVRILVDSSADYTAEEVKEFNLELVPITITLGGNTYRDGLDITKDELYEMLINGQDFPMTSQPSPQDLLDIFEDVKAKGDSLVYISLSSGLSGTFQTANMAKEMTEYEDIYLVDSLSASRGIRLLAEYGCKLREEGKDAAAIAAALEELKSRIVIYVALDTLEFLHRGGRLSKTAAAVGELANLKPLLTVHEDGTLGIPAKCLGRNKAIATLTKMIEEKGVDTSFPFYSVYAYGEENVEKLEGKLKAAGISVTKRLQVGATIGAHIGPGTYGAIFITK